MLCCVLDPTCASQLGWLADIRVIQKVLIVSNQLIPQKTGGLVRALERLGFLTIAPCAGEDGNSHSGWTSLESDSGNRPNSPGWTTLWGEQRTDSSSSSVNGPFRSISTEASGSSDTGETQVALQQKKDELQNLIFHQFRHFYSRGRPKWQLSGSSERNLLDWKCAETILSSLEIAENISEYQDWINNITTNPTLLYPLFRDYL